MAPADWPQKVMNPNFYYEATHKEINGKTIERLMPLESREAAAVELAIVWSDEKGVATGTRFHETETAIKVNHPSSRPGLPERLRSVLETIRDSLQWTDWQLEGFTSLVIMHSRINQINSRLPYNAIIIKPL
jgi:hypothetical protein